MKCWKLNTSNLGKFEEFKLLFAKWDISIEISHFDLKEIDSDSIRVIAHKASQLGEDILVDDTSLEIAGASVGVHVRWLLDHLPEYADCKANWITLLGYHKGNEVLIYKGSVFGTIVEPRGTNGFGFDSVFLPEGSTMTLAQSKPDKYNARAKAVEALIKGNIFARHPIIKKWEGPWQQNIVPK